MNRATRGLPLPLGMAIDPSHLKRMIEEEGGIAHATPSQLPPHCPACQYDLRGAVSDRCPECGHFLVGGEQTEEQERVGDAIKEVEQSAEWVTIGLKIALVGLALRLLGLMLGPGSAFAFLGRVAAVLCGVGSFFLGIGGFRHTQLPQWALDHMKEKPQVDRALGAVAAGIALMLTAIFSPW